MKKHLALSAVFVVASLASGHSFAAFNDVASSHANAEAIAYVQAKNIVSGYADGTFKADASINRAELTKIIVSALFTPAGSNCFPDVHEEWFAPYVCAAKERGIIGGYPDGTFKPEKNISFAEAAKIIAVAFDNEIPTGGSVWYEGYVRSLANAKAIPVSIRNFSALLTRGEMAEMIFRLHAKRTDKPAHSYEKIAGLPELSSSSSSLSSSQQAYARYPYTFSLKNDWQTAWNFYVDKYPMPIKEGEGYNHLAQLDTSHIDRTEEAGGTFPEFLRVRFPKGAASPFVSYFYKKPSGGIIARALGAMKPAESLHLTYYVRFPKDFDFSTSGILPALGGGITTSNYGAWGSDFSVGLYWTKKGEIGISGSFDTTESDATRVTGASLAADGQWHRVDISARMNTVPVKRLNGMLTVRYDNNVIFNFDDVRFRAEAKQLWDSVGLYAYIAGNDTFSIAPKDMYLDLAGFSVSEE